MNINSITEEVIDRRKLIRPMSVKLLAQLYGISPRTMRKRLKPHEAYIGEQIGRFFYPKQLERIFECLGMPKQA